MDEFDLWSKVRNSQRAGPAPPTLEASPVLEGVPPELADAPGLHEFLRREFPRQAAAYESALDRRAFLKLMGAAFAMAGLAACAPPSGAKLVPYVNQPERLVPGLPLYYATAFTPGGYATGLLVRSELGRPIKIEGNPTHPASLGATDIFAQASILTLYDPDRSRRVLQNSQPGTWEAFVTAARRALETARPSGGSGVHLLTPTSSSPTLAAQWQTLLTQFPAARWHSYEPFNLDNAFTGAQLAFGQPVETRCDLTRADVVLALDSDFLNAGPGSLRYAHDFGSRRTSFSSSATVNRLYAVESTLSLTGAQADHRLALRASQIAAFASALAAQVGIAGAAAAPPPEVPSNWIAALAQDLKAHRGASLVLAGACQPPYVHALAHALNNVLGNVGATVTYTDPVPTNPVDQFASLRDLANDMDAGRVQVLLVLDGNPVYNAPVDLQFGERLKRVPFSAHLSLHQDETATACTWHIPQAHYLETWGDARAYDGTVSLIQPLIAPLYSGKSAHEFLSALADPTPQAGDALVKNHWQAQTTGNFDETWRGALSAGIMPNTMFTPRPVTLNTAWVANAPPELPLHSYEVRFCPDPAIGDGTWSNNAWLQELPRPFTKLTWDNIVALSPAAAQQLGVRTEIAVTGGEHGQVETDLVDLQYAGRTLRAPLWIVPGHPDELVTLYAGYGRTQAGNVGNGIGYNAYALRTSDAPWYGAGLELRLANQRVAMATTQFHANMEGRDLVQHATLAQFLQNPNFAQHPEAEVSLYPPPNRQGEQWGMAIDLNACIGCNACVVACQAENNIPTVGKAEVLRAREMHWLRVDRYYEGEGANLQAYFEPVPCMHCEYAPCEVVCPTAATTHSPDGLNEMTYNRCIGTRYCSNNCPYKVRRFNFFQYADWNTESLKPLRNPDVTVRSRGVMEKCTYCVQRINRARSHAEREGRGVRDGEVITACQAACPTQAIVFGNINDPQSRVAQLKAGPRNYALLAELNTRPRTTYLAVVRNPNPELT